MEYLVLIVSDHEIDEDTTDSLGELGFRRNVSVPDQSVAVQLPYASFSAFREGDSLNQVRADIMTALGDQAFSAFVLVAERFACGRT